MIKDKFELEDDAFWIDPWATRKAIQRSMMQSGQEGFFIGAPKVVALNNRETFPIAILRVSKAETATPVDFRGSAIVAVMDMNTDELHARLAFNKHPATKVSASRRPTGKGDSFTGDETAMLSEGHTLDLVSRLQLPLESAEYWVVLICRDKVSNQCPMKIVDSAGFQDPAVEAFLCEQQASHFELPTVYPELGDSLPSYQPHSHSPGLPDQPSIALSVKRVTAIEAQTQCFLDGSFRLPVKAHHVVDQLSLSAEGPSKHAAGATAIVPITLLLTGSVAAAPILLSLAVPSFSSLETVGTESIATGYFSLDLCALADLTSVPQTYFIYAFSGVVMSGPVPSAFVRPPRVKIKIGAGSKSHAGSKDAIADQ